MDIKTIQEWEKEFAKKKGLPPKDKSDADEALKIGFLKLSEEVGELAEKILRKQYNEMQEEVADIIIFASKIGKIAEDYFNQPSTSKIIKKKIEYSEERKYDKKTLDLDKPKGSFKEWNNTQEKILLNNK